MHVGTDPDDVAAAVDRPAAGGRIAPGGIAGLRPHTDSMVFTNPMALWPKRWPRLVSEAVRLHRGPVTPDGQGTSGGAGSRSSFRGSSGVDAGTVLSTSEFFTGLSPTNRL